MRSRSSRRTVPARRSHIAFIRGACTAVGMIVVPFAWKTGGAGGDAPRCIRRVPCPVNTRTYRLVSRTKPTARIPAA